MVAENGCSPAIAGNRDNSPTIPDVKMRQTRVRRSLRTSREPITFLFQDSPTVAPVHPVAGYPVFKKKVVQNGEFRCMDF